MIISIRVPLNIVSKNLVKMDSYQKVHKIYLNQRKVEIKNRNFRLTEQRNHRKMVSKYKRHLIVIKVPF